MTTKPSLLIVEDELVQSTKLQFLLESKGYAVTSAFNGKEALEKIAVHKPDLVISDIIMPEMDGYELCTRIRSDNRYRDILVMLLTSQSDPEDVVRGLACGADNFISKPYDVGDLLDRIEGLLASAAVRAAGTQAKGIAFTFSGSAYETQASHRQILNFFLSTYKASLQKQREIEIARDKLADFNRNLESLVEHRTVELKREIQEREKAEEQLREQAALLDKAQDAIFVTTIEGAIVYWNKSAEQLYGWEAAEVNQKLQLRSLFRGDAGSSPAATLQTVIERGEWNGELHQISKGGKEIIVQSSWTLVRDGAGNPKTILYINTDISERKKMESQFLRTQRMESIGTLAGGIAHDLNNVLAPILLAVALFKARFQDEKSKSMLDMIETSARRGADMVKQVLTFARGIEGERVILQPKHLMREMHGIATQSFPKTIQITLDIPKDLRPVKGDATQLHQVLLNLCVNARDAMPKGGTITLAGENVSLDENYSVMNAEAKPGPYVLVTVTDTGTGIPPEIIDKIFDPFFTTKEVGKGTGLGLSTVHAIIKGHGGFLRVKSEAGRGTQFCIFLPAASMNGASGTEESSRTLPDGQGEKILVVDDEQIIREIMTVTLEKHGYKVLTATDGAEAVAMYAQGQEEYQAVITDMIMPVLDGSGTMQVLQRLNPAVKVIAISGSDEGLRSAEIRYRGSIRTLAKPFTTEQLLTTLHDLLTTQVEHESRTEDERELELT
jgi:two-component system, cell cycle sensor histidine kinase and response regulator CckA